MQALRLCCSTLKPLQMAETMTCVLPDLLCLFPKPRSIPSHIWQVIRMHMVLDCAVLIQPVV